MIIGTCLKEAGVEGVSWTANSLTLAGDDRTELEAIEYRCNAQHPIAPDPDYLLSKAQLAFIYEYWTTSTMPCLRLLGYPSHPVPPSQRIFVDDFYTVGFWSPYWALFESGDEIDWELIDFRCPPLPEEVGWVGR